MSKHRRWSSSPSNIAQVSLSRIQTYRITNWKELQDELFRDKWEGIDRYRTKRLFRGLSNSAYPLTTKIQRMATGFAKQREQTEYLKTIEPLMLRNFQKYAQIDTDKRETDWHLLSVAQHHGLPTRLLDWTNSLFVALHFVTRDPRHYDVDGVVWAVNFLDAHEYLPETLAAARQKGANSFTIGELNENAPKLETLDRLRNKRGEPFLVFFEPPAIDERITNQYAVFSVMPGVTTNPGEWLEAHPSICQKIIIPAGVKPDIRDALDQANLTERVFFPGLDGLSDWLSRYYGRSTRVQDRVRQEKSSLIHRGRHLSFYKGQNEWEYVSRRKGPYGVAIIAITFDNRLVLVRQHRVPMGKDTIELPAGLVESSSSVSDKDILLEAKRELREETGFSCHKPLKLLYRGAALPGVTDEINAICLAEQLRYEKAPYFVHEKDGVRRHRLKRGISGEGEELIVYEVPVRQLEGWLQKQTRLDRIPDLKVYAALSYLHQLKNRR